MAPRQVTGRKSTATADRMQRSAKKTSEVKAPKRPAGTKRGVAAPPISGLPLDKLLSYSIDQFCELHGISIDTYFRMQRDGDGPQVMKVRGRTLISREDAQAWREARNVAARQRREDETASTTDA